MDGTAYKIDRYVILSGFRASISIKVEAAISDCLNLVIHLFRVLNELLAWFLLLDDRHIHIVDLEHIQLHPRGRVAQDGVGIYQVYVVRVRN